MDCPQTVITRLKPDMVNWDPRLRLWLFIIGIVIIYLYPARQILGNGFFLGGMVGVYLVAFRSKLHRTVWFMLVPTVLLFGLMPWLFATTGFSGREPVSELLFGLVIFFKTMTVFLMVVTFIRSMNLSVFLSSLQKIRIPVKILFILMVAARYFSRFVRTVQTLQQARTLRLFGRSRLTGILGALRMLVWDALHQTENVYFATRLRGGKARLPLLVTVQSMAASYLQSVVILLIYSLPWLGLLWK